MKKYKTWEMYKMLTENKELKFKRVGDGMEVNFSKKIKNGKFADYYLHQSNGECPMLSDEWELIQQPIPFMEAVKAYSEGKTIRCELGMQTSTYPSNGIPDCMVDKEHNLAVSCREIMEGKWFIVEDSNE
jgi:hypothetical protein